MSDLHIVCAQCGATNRVGSGQAAEKARCGKCTKALFDGRPADVSGALLDKQIARSDVPVLVDIWAPWCGPCRTMGPEFAAAAGMAGTALRFVKLNADENQDTVARLGIQGIPTMILFRGGKEVGRVSGALSRSDIINWTRQHIFA
jgi:thioredoxin 2